MSMRRHIDSQWTKNAQSRIVAQLLDHRQRRFAHLAALRVLADDRVSPLIHGGHQRPPGPLEHAAQVVPLAGLHNAGADRKPACARSPRQPAALDRSD